MFTPDSPRSAETGAHADAVAQTTDGKAQMPDLIAARTLTIARMATIFGTDRREASAERDWDEARGAGSAE